MEDEIAIDIDSNMLITPHIHGFYVTEIKVN